MNKARLVESADQTAGIRNRALDGGAVARIGAQISRTQFMRGKQRRAAGRSRIRSQVEVAPSREGRTPVLRARRARQRVVVDREFERAEMAAGVTDRALEDRKFIAPARGDVAGLGQKHGDVETVGKALRGLDGDLVAAIDQRDAAALQRHQ